MEHSRDRYLHTYLTDHWAAAGAGVALARRIAAQNRNTSWAGELDEIALQIAADDRTLYAIRVMLGSAHGKLRRGVLVAAERVSRLKLNGRIFRYSPLSRVIEAEGLIGGITAKQRMWVALKDAVVPELPDLDFEQLAERAEAQLTTMRAFHQWAAVTAFEQDPPVRLR